MNDCSPVPLDNEWFENHPYEQITLGQSACLTRTLTLADIQAFAAVSGDTNPAHLDPEYANAWNARCWTKVLMGDLSEAVGDCTQSLKFHAADAVTLASRGLAYLKLKQPDQAIADLKEFLGEEAVRVIDNAPQPGETAVDCTLGHGGHSREILARIQPGGVLLGLDAAVAHVIIVDVKEGVFFARVLLGQDGPVARKIAEVDARPSDSIVLALQQKRPILVARRVFDSVEDMTEILERVLKQQKDEQAGEEEQ